MAKTESKPAKVVTETTALEVIKYPSAEATMQYLSNASKDLIILGDKAITDAGLIVIRTDGDVAKATDFIVRIKGDKETVEEGRKNIGDPLRKAVERVNGYLMPVTKRLEEAEKIVKDKIRDYNLLQEKKRQEELARLQAEEAERRRKFEEEQTRKEKLAQAQGKLVEKQEYVPEPVVVPQATVPTNYVSSKTGASAGMKDNWIFQITNVEDVPRQYLMVNEKMVKAAISTGTRSIPGLRIYNDPIVSVKRG